MPPGLRVLVELACAACILGAGPAAAQDHPLARFAPPAAAAVNGRWNGVDLERRSSCADTQNDGSRGTYAQFDVTADATGGFAIAQSGITGLNCSYVGRHSVVDRRLAVEGTYSCTDGKQGNFRTTALDVHGVSLDIRMAIQLTGTESCTIDALLSMARLDP